MNTPNEPRVDRRHMAEIAVNAVLSAADLERHDVGI
jgi:hypothetical protein